MDRITGFAKTASRTRADAEMPDAIPKIKLPSVTCPAHTLAILEQTIIMSTSRNSHIVMNYDHVSLTNMLEYYVCRGPFTL